MSVWVGVDIGSRTSVVAVRKDGRPAGQWDIAQTPAGRKAAVKKLLALKPKSIVMEATGIYSVSYTHLTLPTTPYV